jgi:NFU1 iron-sulfur cluster scaffold homolog, mitochondrial
MFIETESTPNPATLKFLPGRDILGDKTADFADADAALISPLAESLFGLEGVDRVFLGGDFISVTKSGAVEWQALKPQVLGLIMEHLVENRPILRDNVVLEAEDFAPEDAEIAAQIKDLLDTRIRPAVASDGGDIIFRGFRDGVVSLKMQGSCAGCPSSTATLKHGIENMLKHYIPEVTSVTQAA